MKEQEEELIRRAKLSKQAGTMGKSYVKVIHMKH